MKYFLLSILFIQITFAQKLSDAWLQLLQEHPALQAAEARKQAKSSTLAVSEAALWPTIDLAGSYQYNTDIASTHLKIPALVPGMAPIDRSMSIGDHDRSDFAVTANYAAFTGFAQTHQIAAQKLDIQVSEKDLVQIKNQFAFQFAMIYQGIQIALLDLKFRQQKVQTLLSHHTLLQKQLQGGIATQAQVLGAQADAARAIADTSLARKTLDSLANEFLNLTNVPYPWQDSLHYEFGDTNSASENPIAEGLELQAQSVLQNGQMTNAKLWPMVQIFASYRMGNPGLDQGSDAWMGYGVFGLQAQWTVFDGYTHRAQEARFNASAKALQWEAERQRRTQNTNLSALSMERQALQAERLALLQADTATRGALQAYQQSFQNGIATSQEVLDAEMRVAEISTRLAQWQIRTQILEIRKRMFAGQSLQIHEVKP